MQFFKNYKKPSDKKLIVVLSGAGISAESGIKTFRDSDGLWQNHDVKEVASPEGWKNTPELVLEFYNQRRKQAFEVEPNLGHKTLADLENQFEVVIITQNVDALHERAGSTKVLHLHGELSKVRSTLDSSLIYDIGGDPIILGDLCEKGGQLRPHIVWFGEPVPFILDAYRITVQADYFICVGTSLQVQPANILITEVQKNSPKFLVDPNVYIENIENLTIINEKATIGLPLVAKKIIELENK